MNQIMSFIMSLVFALLLTMVVGFVVASIKGFTYDFGSAVPYGILIGLIVYLFGQVVTAEHK